MWGWPTLPNMSASKEETVTEGSSLKHVILGTAGHIDHGKTSLIKAVTGINTDRLKEEKLRGITIELGFAWLKLPSGQSVGIVDVPGHEKFVKNMVAGATGIDLVALIIAADEGVMPQTREHLDICKLLGIKHGMVVVTKIDMVEEEWLELVTDDLKSFLEGSFLEGAPVVRVSSVTGQGIDEFVNVLEGLCQGIPERSASGLFRLPVDRVFSMKGFGTVITGSLMSGRISVGETIMVYPSGIQSKVRGIQIHGQTAEEATAGVRTAINFQGLDRTSINRGDVLARVNTLKPSYMVDVVLNFLGFGKKPFKNRTKVRFYTGSSEIEGNIILMDRDELKAGEQVLAQLRLETPVSLQRDDRFVIRSYSPVKTIAGGYVIDPIPAKHKRFKEDVIAHLKYLAESDQSELVSYQAQASGLHGVSFADLVIMTNMSEKGLEQELRNLLSKKIVLQMDRDKRLFLHGRVFDELQQNALGILKAFHKENPLKPGMIKEVFKSKLSKTLGFHGFSLLVQTLTKLELVVQEKELIRLAGHKIALEADQKEIRRKIHKAYLDGGLQPPYFKELITSIGQNAGNMKDVLGHLVKEGLLIKVKEDLYFDSVPIKSLKEKVVDFLRANGELTTPQFKEIAGVSRKYMIPLIEYFDDTKLTIRVGDIRRLREG